MLRNHENRTFTVNFRCQPFWYAEAVQPITLTASGGTITNPGNVPSEPVITVFGSGEITLMVGQTIVELEGISDSITLDCSLMEAYFAFQPIVCRTWLSVSNGVSLIISGISLPNTYSPSFQQKRFSAPLKAVSFALSHSSPMLCCCQQCGVDSWRCCRR